MVAEINRRIVGFGVIVPKENEVRAIYVSPQVKRKGIGSALLRKLEELAKEKGIKKLRLESSVTAEKFYQKNGYKVIKRGYFTLRTGRKMKSVKMKKLL
jgi:putative acetyltransferase